MSDETTGGFAEVTSDDGWTVGSNTESADQIKANLATEEKAGTNADADEGDDDVSSAAAKLGKKGGEAAAKARKAKAKEEAEDADEDSDKGEPKKEPKEAKPAKPEADEKARREADERSAAERRRRDAQERIRQLDYERNEERRARVELEQRLARLEQERQRPAQEQEPRQRAQSTPDNPDDPKPAAEDFDDYADFVEARGRWAARQEMAQFQRQAQVQQYARAVAEDMSRRGSEAKSVIDKAREAVPDLDQRVDPRLWGLSPTWTLPPGTRPTWDNVLADALMGVENPETFAHVALYLTEHEDEVRRIASLPTPSAIMQAVGRLEAKLAGTNGTTPQKRPGVSQARPPIPAVTGSARTADEDSDDEDLDSHIKRHNAKEFAAKKRGR